MVIEAKDIKRLEDIKAQPGKEIGLATKQAKLIKDPAKATRRWLASISVFGSDHSVTQIFRNRKYELNGADTMVVTSSSVVRVEAKTESPAVTQNISTRLERSQSDFPVGCKVKRNEKIGIVTLHDNSDDQSVLVDFDGTVEDVNIYDIKRC